MDKFRLVRGWKTRLVNDGDGHFDEMEEVAWFVAEEMPDNYIVIVDGPMTDWREARTKVLERNEKEPR